MTIRKEGEKRRLPERTFLMRPRIICSQALKSAITPSLSGRITRILLLVQSHDGGLVHCDFSVGNDDGVCRAQVNGEFLGEGEEFRKESHRFKEGLL